MNAPLELHLRQEGILERHDSRNQIDILFLTFPDQPFHITHVIDTASQLLNNRKLHIVDDPALVIFYIHDNGIELALLHQLDQLLHSLRSGCGSCDKNPLYLRPLLLFGIFCFRGLPRSLSIILLLLHILRALPRKNLPRLCTLPAARHCHHRQYRK